MTQVFKHIGKFLTVAVVALVAVLGMVGTLPTYAQQGLLPKDLCTKDRCNDSLTTTVEKVSKGGIAGFAESILNFATNVAIVFFALSVLGFFWAGFLFFRGKQEDGRKFLIAMCWGIGIGSVAFVAPRLILAFTGADFSTLF